MHFAVAPSGAPAADLVGAFAAVLGGVGGTLGGSCVGGAGAAVGAFVFVGALVLLLDAPPNQVLTPPCCEHAPRCVFALV